MHWSYVFLALTHRCDIVNWISEYISASSLLQVMTCHLFGVMLWTHLPLDKMATISQMIFSNFVNEKFCILIQISLKFLSKSAIDNNPALAYSAPSHYLNQCRPYSLTHICGTRGRWVNSSWPDVTYMWCEKQLSFALWCIYSWQIPLFLL